MALNSGRTLYWPTVITTFNSYDRGDSVSALPQYLIMPLGDSCFVTFAHPHDRSVVLLSVSAGLFNSFCGISKGSFKLILAVPLLHLT